MSMASSKSKDYDIRAAAVRHLLEHGWGRNCIRHELTLETSSSGGRADLVLLHDAGLVGIELKSACDTLDRCADQARTYGMAFDHRILLIDSRHVAKDHTGWPRGPKCWAYNTGDVSLPIPGYKV